MRCIMVMFDTLSKRFLPNYGCDWTQMPNFQRLGKKTITFDNAWVGSMPCMPARREMHTGRYNFLHRGWGPLEPWDDSAITLLNNAGVYTHLSSDHYHYWEEGGTNYHTKYKSWDFHRGQEGDPWIGQVKDPVIPNCYAGSRKGPHWRQDWVNRPYMATRETSSQGKTFAAGAEFIERNKAEQNWYLQIECFDPHEPYFVPKEYREKYGVDESLPHWDWPNYGRFPEIDPKQKENVRKIYAALMSMCDDHLGRVLDLMDKHDLWKDTMLIVNTDHGTLLGEHDEWQKMRQPFYNEVAQIPLFIWDPRVGKAGERRKALVQTIDLPATLLEYFGVARPKDMQGLPLKQTLMDDTALRTAALSGMFGGHVNVTDGRYMYMRAPAREDCGPLNHYTHTFANMRDSFSVESLRPATMHPPFSFTKGCPVVRVPVLNDRKWSKAQEYGTLLFDLEKDPLQNSPLKDAAVEKKMIAHLVRLMKATDAPAEQFERLGLA
ncbi:MAG TPA: sulfatase [Planctomycetota bacterium]|nr:sulfatase [Planctomycetota bacterium]